MSRVTHYGYFGRTANIKDAPIDAAGVAAFAAMIASLAPRPAAAPRGPNGEPLRFIPIEEIGRG